MSKNDPSSGSKTINHRIQHTIKNSTRVEDRRLSKAHFQRTDQEIPQGIYRQPWMLSQIKKCRSPSSLQPWAVSSSGYLTIFLPTEYKNGSYNSVKHSNQMVQFIPRLNSSQCPIMGLTTHAYSNLQTYKSKT